MDSELENLDFYKILGVHRLATASEIKMAYRRKALQCHPDKHPGDPNAASKFLQLSKILAILTDSTKRASYDRTYNYGRGRAPEVPVFSSSDNRVLHGFEIYNILQKNVKRLKKESDYFIKMNKKMEQKRKEETG